MATGKERLSANMAALSYALELSGGIDDAPLEIRVGSGRRPGPLERRRQDPDIASPDEHSLEFEEGKPLKNLGRMLAYSAGIPLPYNFRQSAEAAEQARIDYENENTMVGDMADTFLEQMDENALHAADDAETRIYQQYAAQGRDAVAAFFAQDASPEQRAAAYQRLTKLDDEARAVRNADSNERTKFVRGFLGQELATSRAALVDLDMAEKDRVAGLESELAQLDNVRPGSTEEQVLLRTMLATGIQRSQSGLAAAASALGGTSMMSGNPYAVAAGAALQVAGAVLERETAELDRDTVVKMRLEMHDTMDRLTQEFRPALAGAHERVVGDAKSYGIPASSWATERIPLETPYANSYRERLFGEGGGSRAPSGEDLPPAPPARWTAAEEMRDMTRSPVTDEIRERLRGQVTRRPTR